MTVESDRAKQQFHAANKVNLQTVHEQIDAAVRAENQKIMIDQPGFVFVHVDGKPVTLNDPNAFNEVKP